MWQFRIDVSDVSDVSKGSVPGAHLDLSTWTGSGPVTVQAQQTIGETFEFTAADAVVNVVISLQHPRFAPLVINLVRAPGERAWRWTDPRIRVTTHGGNVVVQAVLSRVRPAPITFVLEDLLTQRATQAKGPRDAAARSHRPPLKPPAAVLVDSLPGVLVGQDKTFYRNSGAPDRPSFHVLAPAPLGDAGQKDWPATAPSWERFRTTVQPATPGRSGRIHIVEYGEVGAQSAGPRFLAALWFPHDLARVGRGAVDFLVWFTPNTVLPFYPEAQYPFRGNYPYAFTARDALQPTTAQPYIAIQPYTELAFAHWFGQHHLAYQMLAARRSAVIVVPVAPSSHFELWESPKTLMRMLKELCRWIPRDDDGRIPKVHPTPPVVGRVGVAGFSAAVDRLDALLNRHEPDMHYHDDVWGRAVDRTHFDNAWRELWSIDGSFHGNLRRHSTFLNKAAQWARQSADRRLRLYKNDFTDGRWDPRAEEPRGDFAREMKNAACVERGKDTHWALFCASPTGHIQALSMSKSYSISPGTPQQVPEWDNRPHENMPRLCGGHAMTTSGFAPHGVP